MKHLLGMILLIAGCGPMPGPSSGYGSGIIPPDAVRVALAHAAAEVRFTARAGVDWSSVDRKGAFGAGSCVVTERGGRLWLEQDGVELDLGANPVRLAGGGDWIFAGDRFPGTLILQRSPWGGVTLVNVVGIEEYLRGVVPWEIGRPQDDALEAVKAQAIAARTYTIRHLGRWAELGFDLFADTRDQVYRGRTGTAPITDRAVRDTRGLVLVHDGDLVRAYYSSTCGGHTSTLTDVWDRDGAPYLQGFRDDDARGRSWCRDSAQFRWVEAWSARELGDAVREFLGAEIGEELAAEEIGILDGVEVVERDRSGRVSRLLLRTDRGQWEVWGDRIRWVLRPAHSRFGILRSTLFSVEEIREGGALVGVVVRGGGFGHGVGLCQTGALGRARAGQDAGEILRAYYPGVRIQPHPAALPPS